MANTTNDEIKYHHRTSDPTDYQVEDVLVCIADGCGLRVGEFYSVHAVWRERTRVGVITTITVRDNFALTEVRGAESFLRRTRVLAELTSPAGQLETHSFPNAEELHLWCTFCRLAPDEIRNQRYVEADPAPPRRCRFTAMCVPGELDDGSDTVWYVHDRRSGVSDLVGIGADARPVAHQTAREANRRWMATGVSAS